MTKLGKLYELMAYGDDLDAFYSMNKQMTKPIHTENDREIMELLNEAKKEAPTNVNEGSIRLFKYDMWFKKYFGEP
jgi:hypothetical protein